MPSLLPPIGRSPSVRPFRWPDSNESEREEERERGRESAAAEDVVINDALSLVCAGRARAADEDRRRERERASERASK